MDENRCLHSLGVAKKMVVIGKSKGLKASALNDLFTLGIVHDIGYEFGPGNEHQKLGGLVLKENGYRNWQEVYYHGLIQNEYSSLFLDILNQADMQIDKKGKDVGYEGRLADIKSRYGEGSNVYASCVELVNFIMANNSNETKNGIKKEEVNTPSKHAIIIIKNNNNEYLQCYESSWKSYLFLNCKVKEEKDLEPIKTCIKEKLGVEPQNITYLFNKIHSKYSVKHQKMREYEHYFYLVDIDTKTLEAKKEFSLNDTKFKWFGMEELEKNPEIMQINGDIIGVIKEWFTK